MPMRVSSGIYHDAEVEVTQEIKIDLWVPSLAAAIALICYLFTILPEIDFGDAAEFGIQAKFLGLLHPPGYPLHSVLAKAFTLLPVNPSYATNLFSSVCAALTVGILSFLIIQLTGQVVLSLVVPLSFAFSNQLWPVAVTTEVYALHALTFSFSIVMLMYWSRSPSRSRAFATGVSFGASIAGYLANLLLAPAYLLFMWQRRRPLDVTMILIAICLICVSILGWTLFRVESADPPIGTQFLPDSVSGIWNYFRGKQ